MASFARCSGQIEMDEVRRLAFDCSAALDRGNQPLAQRLAEQGLELATRAGDPTWVRRFQHLLRVASGQSIPNFPQPYDNRPRCNFCLTAEGSITISGGGKVICDDCVRRCIENRFEGSGIERISTTGVTCSFCGHPSTQPSFGARGYHICQRCIGWILDNTPS